MGEVIRNAVQLALGGFLTLATRQDADAPKAPAIEGAYQLGRGEARSGRTVEALLAAYRIGARASWRDMSGVAVEAGVDSGQLAQFAELVFAYIDELSAASVAGHTDELESSGRVRQRNLERLARALLTGAPADAVDAAAERADWEPPGALTALVLPGVAGLARPHRPRPAHAPAHRRRPGAAGGPRLAARARHRLGRLASYVAPGAARHRRGRRPRRAVAGGRCVATAAPCGARPSASTGSSTPTSTSPRWCWPPTPSARDDLRARVLAPARRPAPLDRREADRHAPQLAAPPRPPRRGGRGAVRPRPDRALPRRPAPGDLRRPARGPGLRARRDARAGLTLGGTPPL